MLRPIGNGIYAHVLPWPGFIGIGMSDSEKENKTDACEQNFTLSAKTVRKMTREEFGYEMSSNAFDLLNQRAKENLQKGLGVGDVNDWVMRVLERLEGGRFVKRSDIELVMEQVGKVMKIDHESCDDQLESDLAGKLEEKKKIDIVLMDQNSESTCDIVQKSETVVDIVIVQLPSLGQVELMKELEDEIERLKKIIQIILNKQAELI